MGNGHPMGAVVTTPAIAARVRRALALLLHLRRLAGRGGRRLGRARRDRARAARRAGRARRRLPPRAPHARSRRRIPSSGRFAARGSSSASSSTATRPERESIGRARRQRAPPTRRPRRRHRAAAERDQDPPAARLHRSARRSSRRRSRRDPHRPKWDDDAMIDTDRRPHRRGPQLPRRPPARVRGARGRAARAAGGAARAPPCRRAAGLPARDGGDPRRRLARRADAGRDRRPARRDHGAGRPEDGDQRAQLGRAGVHGGLRGLELADLGQLHRRAAQPDRRARADDLARHRREAVHARRTSPAVLFVRPRGWHLEERHFEIDGAPMSGSLFDFGLYFFRNHGRNGRYFYVPKLESHLEARLWNDVFTWSQERLGVAARDDQGNRPDRDDPRRVRDGRDPLRAARPLGRAQRRPLGLHLQRDQEARPPARDGAARPQRGDDGGAVHALLLRAARQDLPPARRLRDGRHGGLHPLAPRRRGQRRRAREGARGQGARGVAGIRRHLGRPSRPRADRLRGVRRRPRRPAQPDRPAARRRRRHAPPTCSTSPPPPARRPRTASATTSRSGSSTSPPGSRAPAPSRSTT